MVDIDSSSNKVDAPNPFVYLDIKFGRTKGESKYLQFDLLPEIITYACLYSWTCCN